jgi:hypothetical protein
MCLFMSVSEGINFWKFTWKSRNSCENGREDDLFEQVETRGEWDWCSLRRETFREIEETTC